MQGEQKWIKYICVKRVLLSKLSLKIDVYIYYKDAYWSRWSWDVKNRCLFVNKTIVFTNTIANVCKLQLQFVNTITNTMFVNLQLLCKYKSITFT